MYLLLIVLVACCIVGTGVVGEVWLRRRSLQQKDSRINSSAFSSCSIAQQALHDVSRCVYESHPFLMYRLKPGQDAPTFHVNERGFRGPELRQGSQIRLVLLGNSVMWGTGASGDNTTIAGCLERQLRALGYDCEVINGGMRSYVTDQELILLHREVLDLAPDLVVCVDGITDIDVAIGNGMVGYSPDFFVHRRRQSDPVTLRRLLAKWAKRSHVVTQCLSYLKPSSGTPQRVDFPSYSEIADHYIKNIKYMAQLCAGNDCLFMAVLHPTLATKAQLAPEESLVLLVKEAELPGYGSFVRRCYVAMKERGEGLAAEGVLHFADLSAVFDQQAQTVFFDWTHFADDGNELLAGALTARILEATPLPRLSKQAAAEQPGAVLYD